MRRARLIPFFLCAVVAPAPLCAQWALTADAGVSHLRQAGIPESNAQTFGATLDAAGERSVLRTSFLAALAASGSWTSQGLVVGSIVGPNAGMARWQLDGALSAFGETSEASTTSAEIAARARLGTSLRGGALGVGLGSNSRGSTRNPLYRAQGDGWWSIGVERVIASVALTRTRSIFSVASNTQASSPSVSYLDVGANWRHDAGGLTVGAGGGLRTQSGSPHTSSGWGAIDASAWLSPRFAVAVGAGRTLDDVVRGVPHAAFVSVAVRIAIQPHASMLARPQALVGPRISVERLSDDLLRVDVRADGASRIEMMGDFTNWSPVVLAANDNVWRLERAIAPGPHRIAIRIDGGPWIVPVNLPRIEDDLGGTVGIITAP